VYASTASPDGTATDEPGCQQTLVDLPIMTTPSAVFQTSRSPRITGIIRMETVNVTRCYESIQVAIESYDVGAMFQGTRWCDRFGRCVLGFVHLLRATESSSVIMASPGVDCHWITVVSAAFWDVVHFQRGVFRAARLEWGLTGPWLQEPIESWHTGCQC
jgi:hypothetical protein